MPDELTFNTGAATFAAASTTSTWPIVSTDFAAFSPGAETRNSSLIQPPLSSAAFGAHILTNMSLYMSTSNGAMPMQGVPAPSQAIALVRMRVRARVRATVRVRERFGARVRVRVSGGQHLAR